VVVCLKGVRIKKRVDNNPLNFRNAEISSIYQTALKFEIWISAEW
jgi:hypothetical protein